MKTSLYRKLKHTQKNVRLIIVDHLISKNTFQKSCGRRRLSAREKQQCLQSFGLPHTVAAANKQSACMQCSQAGRRRNDDKCPSQTSLRCSNVACSVPLCKKLCSQACHELNNLPTSWGYIYVLLCKSSCISFQLNYKMSDEV